MRVSFPFGFWWVYLLLPTRNFWCSASSGVDKASRLFRIDLRNDELFTIVDLGKQLPRRTTPLQFNSKEGNLNLQVSTVNFGKLSVLPEHLHVTVSRLWERLPLSNTSVFLLPDLPKRAYSCCSRGIRCTELKKLMTLFLPIIFKTRLEHHDLNYATRRTIMCCKQHANSMILYSSYWASFSRLGAAFSSRIAFGNPQVDLKGTWETIDNSGACLNEIYWCQISMWKVPNGLLAYEKTVCASGKPTCEIRPYCNLTIVPGAVWHSDFRCCISCWHYLYRFFATCAQHNDPYGSHYSACFRTLANCWSHALEVRPFSKCSVDRESNVTNVPATTLMSSEWLERGHFQGVCHQRRDVDRQKDPYS